MSPDNFEILSLPVARPIDVEAYAREINEQLFQLRQEYERRARPLYTELVELENRWPSQRPILMRKQ